MSILYSTVRETQAEENTMITLDELKEIKKTNEENGLSERRVRARLADAVKKSGMVDHEYMITPEGTELLTQVWGK